MFTPRSMAGVWCLCRCPGSDLQCQSALFEAEEGRPSAIYQAALEQRPEVWRRLEGARCVSQVRVLKRMGNRF